MTSRRSPWGLTPALLDPLYARIAKICGLPPSTVQASDAADTLLKACSQVLRDDGKSPNPPHALRLLTLAHLTCAVTDRKRLLADSSATLTTQAAKKRTMLALVEEMARQERVGLAGFLEAPDAFEQLTATAAGFAAAIAPRRLHTLVNNRAELAGRVRAFLDQRCLSDAQVEDAARRRFAETPDLTSADAAHLAARLGPRKLRTYDKEGLDRIGQNFAKWHGLVDYLERRGRAPARDEVMESAIQALVERLAGVVRRYSSGRAEEAAQEALLKALELPTRRGGAFTYEMDFFWWLVETARHALPPRVPVVPLKPMAKGGVPKQAPPNEQEALEALQVWTERYLLVERFFQARSRGRVKAIWEQMLVSSEDDTSLSDEELAVVVRERTGEDCSAAAIPGIRRRLRQRLEALRYVLDDVPDGASDEPGDASLIAFLKAGRGLSQEDLPTVRCLAALGRAARGNEPVVWALLARLLVDHRLGPEVAVEAVMPIIKARCELGMSVEDRAHERCRRVEAWCANKANRARLGKSRRRSRDKKIGFFAAACWYLVVLRETGVTGVVSVLRPAPFEREPLENLCAVISGEEEMADEP